MSIMDHSLLLLASRNTIFSGPICISLLLRSQMFLSPQAKRSPSTLMRFFLLRHRSSQRWASKLQMIRACWRETDRQGSSRSTLQFLHLSVRLDRLSLRPMKNTVFVMFFSQVEVRRAAQLSSGKQLMWTGTGLEEGRSGLGVASGPSAASLPMACSSRLVSSNIFQLTFLAFSSQHLRSGPMQVMTSVASFFSMRPMMPRMLSTSGMKFLRLRSFCWYMKPSTMSSMLLLATASFWQIRLQKMRANSWPDRIWARREVGFPKTVASSQKHSASSDGLFSNSWSLRTMPRNPTQMRCSAETRRMSPRASKQKMMSRAFLGSLKILLPSLASVPTSKMVFFWSSISFRNRFISAPSFYRVEMMFPFSIQQYLQIRTALPARHQRPGVMRVSRRVVGQAMRGGRTGDEGWQEQAMRGWQSLGEQGGELVLEVFDCAVEDGHVVAGHVDHLEAVGEVVEQVELRVQVLHARRHDDVREDRQHLVRVQHPLLLLQAVTLVERLDLPRDALGAGRDGLHLVDGGAGLGEFVEAVLAALEGVVGVGVLVDFDVLDDAFPALCAHLADVGLERALVEAELVLDREPLGAAPAQHLQDVSEARLLVAEVVRDGVEDEGVEVVVLEEDAGAAAQHVLLVGDEQVEPALRERPQRVVVHHCLLQDQQELLDVVHQLAQHPASDLRIPVPPPHHPDELRLHAAQHAGGVVEVDLQNVGELHEDLELVRGGLGDFCGGVSGGRVVEADEGALEVVAGEAAGAAVGDDVAAQMLIALGLDAAFLDVDDALARVGRHHLAAERHDHRLLEVLAEGLHLLLRGTAVGLAHHALLAFERRHLSVELGAREVVAADDLGQLARPLELLDHFGTVAQELVLPVDLLCVGWALLRMVFLHLMQPKQFESSSRSSYSDSPSDSVSVISASRSRLDCFISGVWSVPCVSFPIVAIFQLSINSLCPHTIHCNSGHSHHIAHSYQTARLIGKIIF